MLRSVTSFSNDKFNDSDNIAHVAASGWKIGMAVGEPGHEAFPLCAAGKPGRPT